MTVTEGCCLIDGKAVAGRRRGEVRNPANVAEVVGTYPLLEAGDVDLAVRGAQRAQASWRRVPAVERAAIVLKSAEQVSALGGLRDLLIREQGKVAWEAAFELGYYDALADVYAQMGEELDRGTTLLDDTLGTAIQFHQPVGVVAAITPWNYPFGIAAMKVIPAVIAGCSVIIKPSPVAPLTVLEGFASLAGHFPPGVISVLTGSDAGVSAHLLAHPGVRKVSLTGSTPTGRIAAGAAAPTLKSVTLELGGNDAALLLDDIDIDGDLCGSLLAGAFTTTGQVCVAIKRVYAPRRLVDAVAEGLLAELRQAVVGDGLDAATTMGPLTTERQRQVVQRLVAGAESAGARVRRGGTLNGDPSRGWFLQPAIVTGCPEDNPLVQSEQFGPALPIQPYDDVDQAVNMINATEYGLTSSVWANDVERGHRVARDIHAGTVHLNSHGLFAMDPRTPFGGVKQSGIGREMGAEGLYSFTESQVINGRAV